MHCSLTNTSPFIEMRQLFVGYPDKDSSRLCPPPATDMQDARLNIHDGKIFAPIHDMLFANPKKNYVDDRQGNQTGFCRRI